MHGLCSRSRPGLLNASDSGYPWLADSWPATSLPVNSGSGGPNDLNNFGRGDLYRHPHPAVMLKLMAVVLTHCQTEEGPIAEERGGGGGKHVMPSAQADKTGTMLSDGAIYSSIDFTTKGGFGSPSPASQATPYATTQILHSNSIHELAVDLPEAQWKTSLQAKQEMANLGYSLPDKNSCNNTLLFIPDYRLADGLSNRMPHNQSQDFSTTSSHNSSDRSNSLSGWYFTGQQLNPHLSFSLPLSPFTSTNRACFIHLRLTLPSLRKTPNASRSPSPVGTIAHRQREVPPMRTLSNRPAAGSGKGGKKKKTKANAKPTKMNGSNWANVPLPPPPVHPLPGTEMDHYASEHHDGGGYDSDGWGPPLPVQTYLHQGLEDELEEEEERVPTPPIRGVASSPAAVSFGKQHMQGGPYPPQAPAPPVGYVSSTLVSDIETDLPDEDDDEEEDEGYEMSPPIRGIEHTPGSSMDNLDSSVTGCLCRVAINQKNPCHKSDKCQRRRTARSRVVALIMLRVSVCDISCFTSGHAQVRSMVNGWGSASEDDDRNFSSRRSSAGSSSDGSLFTHCSFARALVAAADKAGYRLDGTSLSKRDKGLPHRPRPASPFSTDGSTVGTHSLGHQRAARPTRKHKGPGTAPHRRDASADDLPPPPEPPPCQTARVQGARNMPNPSDRKASSLERQPMMGLEEMKSSLDRQARTSLERHQQAQDRLGSIERGEESRRGQKNGPVSEEAILPYNKPSFPSPGGHSSSGTASSKGSTGPRKGEGTRGQHQRSEQGESSYMGTNAQYSGELCESKFET
ncbi:hypothetical protein H4Q32_013360 [Labeo rohita]|uniref:Roundabout-like protein n=1 Tax=Labeo rohita TaxID=84645 RepID=A0ABQ8M197_LABRO|nr:hypothetical protein H4Q32_013360 [Labeo rohita]